LPAFSLWQLLQPTTGVPLRISVKLSSRSFDALQGSVDPFTSLKMASRLVARSSNQSDRVTVKPWRGRTEMASLLQRAFSGY
jgi:hypothetical protein